MIKQFTILVMFTFSMFGCGAENSKTTAITEKQEGVAVAGTVQNISVTEAEPAIAKGGVQFIDVRTIEEFKESRAKSSVNIPLDILDEKLGGLKKNEPVYVICRTGARSAAAAQILKENGFEKIYNIKGGMLDWEKAKLPMEAGS